MDKEATNSVFFFKMSEIPDEWGKLWYALETLAHGRLLWDSRKQSTLMIPDTRKIVKEPQSHSKVIPHW